jgi:hypothetical protein
VWDVRRGDEAEGARPGQLLPMTTKTGRPAFRVLTNFDAYRNSRINGSVAHDQYPIRIRVRRQTKANSLGIGIVFNDKPYTMPRGISLRRVGGALWKSIRTGVCSLLVGRLSLILLSQSPLLFSSFNDSRHLAEGQSPHFFFQVLMILDE